MSPTGLDPRVYPRTVLYKPGADPGFEVRGGDALKNIFGLFRVKNHDFTQQNHIFSNFRGAAPPGSAPVSHHSTNRAKEDIYLSS